MCKESDLGFLELALAIMQSYAMCPESFEDFSQTCVVGGFSFGLCSPLSVDSDIVTDVSNIRNSSKYFCDCVLENFAW